MEVSQIVKSDIPAKNNKIKKQGKSEKINNFCRCERRKNVEYENDNYTHHY